MRPFAGASGSQPNPDPQQYVVADEVKLYDADNHLVADVYLPNLDLRIKQTGDFVPSRYTGTDAEVYGLPRLLSTEARVIDTNGVFCDVMVGNCTCGPQ